MATSWNRSYKGKIIQYYWEVDVVDRPEVFSDMPQNFWWLHNDATFSSRGKSLFDLTPLLPKVNSLDTQIERQQYRANKAVLDELQKDAEPYIPYSTGHLTNSASVDAMNGILKYTADYAGYAFEPNTPMGTPKKYDKSVHAEARGFPVEYVQEKNEQKYVNLWVKEVLSDG